MRYALSMLRKMPITLPMLPMLPLRHYAACRRYCRRLRAAYVTRDMRRYCCARGVTSYYFAFICYGARCRADAADKRCAMAVPPLLTLLRYTSERAIRHAAAMVVFSVTSSRHYAARMRADLPLRLYAAA